MQSFFEAVFRGDVTAVRSMIAQDPTLVRSAGDHGKTALHSAAEHDQAEVAEALLEAGADLEARTAWGASPFDWAAVMGSGRVADLLLERGATGLTLVTAAALGKRDVVASLMESGPDVSEHARRGAPRRPDDQWPADSAHLLGDVVSDALYGAARNGHTSVVEYLLARGASPDAKGFFGAGALHWAAINGHHETVRLLLRAGADATVRDARFGSTAPEWALEGGHADIAALLEEGL